MELKQCRAYTMVELALVLVIAGLLIGMLRPAYFHISDEMNSQAAIDQINDIASKIEKFGKDNGRYPDSLNEVFDPIPLDPWGHPYQYLNIYNYPHSSTGKSRKDKNLIPINSDYDLYSMGPDGQSASPLTANISQDDIIRGRNGSYVGIASQY